MTASLIYLHGFISSPQSHKAVLMGDYLRRHHPDINYQVPALGDTPDQAIARAEIALDRCLQTGAGPVALMGSSQGGFLATVLAERHRLGAVLINPVVNPQRLATHFLGRHVNPYTGSQFSLDHSHLALLAQLAVPQLQQPARYWVLLQQGDETLDYRQAEDFYRHSRLTVEAGGDHSFQGFERYLPEVVEFLGLLG